MTERYVIDRNQIALVFDGAGVQTHRYLYGTQIDQVLADETATGMVWALADREGTVTDLIDNSGVVVNHITYDSFGKVQSQSNAGVGFRYGYTGREQDSETGLDYYRARYYDPSNGRFISEDSLGFGGGDTNLYRYVENEPILNIDSSGQFKVNRNYWPVITIAGITAYHIDIDVFDFTGERVYYAAPADEDKARKLQPTPIVAKRKFEVGQSTGKDYSQTIYDDGTDCRDDELETQIYQNFQLIQAARIEYYALGDFRILFKQGPNSNSSAWWVISQTPELNQNKPSAPARWSPGWTLNPFKFKRYKGS